MISLFEILGRLLVGAAVVAVALAVKGGVLSSRELMILVGGAVVLYWIGEIVIDMVKS